MVSSDVIQLIIYKGLYAIKQRNQPIKLIILFNITRSFAQLNGFKYCDVTQII